MKNTSWCTLRPASTGDEPEDLKFWGNLNF